MKKLLSVLSIPLFFSVVLKAQDQPFTQYPTTPLLVNPAMTGLVPDDFRLATNRRVQWNNTSANPAISLTGSFDMSLLKGKLPKGDALGVGIVGLYNISGARDLTNNTIGVSLSYHKAFGKRKLHHLSLGGQAMQVQKHLDFPKLTYETIYLNRINVPANPGAPGAINPVISYADYNVGMLYSGRISKRAALSVGYSQYHISRPVEYFIPNDGQTTSVRNLVFVGSSFDLSNKVNLYANVLYKAQAGAQDIYLSASCGIVLNSYDKGNLTLYVGGLYTYLDALAPSIAFEWNKARIGFSYSSHVARFKSIEQSNGGYEISFVWAGGFGKRSPDWHCPKFN
jgi:type IX secretion system PorP/SprF family membrane protein